MKNSNYGAFLPHKKSKRANLFVGAMAILLSSFMVLGICSSTYVPKLPTENNITEAPLNLDPENAVFLF